MKAPNRLWKMDFRHTIALENLKQPPVANLGTKKDEFLSMLVLSSITNTLYTPNFGENTIFGGRRLTLVVSLVELN
jgi:hypothetical protein